MFKPVFTPEFLKRYSYNPYVNPVGQFTYLRTYSRWLEDKKRREKWVETCIRCVEYSFSLYSGPATPEQLQAEAEEMFDYMYKVWGLPSGRTMWVGGIPEINEVGSANFNCSFTTIEKLKDFCELFYLLMVGTGVGFSAEKQYTDKLPKLRKDVTISFEEYNFCGFESKEYLEGTYSISEELHKTNLFVGDSKEGWTDGLHLFLALHQFEGHINTNLNSVRPEGARLKRFGGKASGPGPYRNMLQKIHDVIVNAPEIEGEPGWVQLRPIDVLDIANIIGENVVAGGVRRTAEICLMGEDDFEIIEAKDNYWAKGKDHRAMSNNSIMFWHKPTIEYLKSLKDKIKESYEPGFVNALAAAMRRPWFAGFNPCVEILLAKKAFCNLCNIFLMEMIVDTPDGKAINVDRLRKVLKSQTRHGMRITNIDIELPEWDTNQKRDRLIGVSLTGAEDAFDACYSGFDTVGEDGRLIRVTDDEGKYAPTMTVDDLKKWAHGVVDKEAKEYAFELRIPEPLLKTCIQPGGTGSQLGASGPCSAGFHKSFAPYFIRRIRINSFDALAKTVMAQGYRIFPEVGWGGTSQAFSQLPEDQQLSILFNSKTWVVEFAVKSPASMKASDESAVGQLDRYFSYQKFWTDHNTSATIQVGDDEWDELFEYLHERWDDYVGVSFQNKSNDKYDLAPYEAITEEEYNERIKDCPMIDVDLLNAIENGVNSADEDLDSSCATGACPSR